MDALCVTGPVTNTVIVAIDVCFSLISMSPQRLSANNTSVCISTDAQHCACFLPKLHPTLPATCRQRNNSFWSSLTNQPDMRSSDNIAIRISGTAAGP
ncbi:hypothetical protein D3C87_1839140 [compost metagenome]